MLVHCRRALDGGDMADGKHKLQSHIFRTIVVLLFLVFPSLSANMLAVFNCKDLHGQAYLDADIRIQCYTAEHNFCMCIAALGICLYALGIPAGFMWLLFKYQVPSLAKHKRNCDVLSRVLEYVVACEAYKGASDLSRCVRAKQRCECMPTCCVHC